MTKYLLPVVVVIAAPAAAQTGPQAQITAAMADSAAAWNRGDLPGFMALYAADALFAGGNTLKRDTNEIAAGYAKSFVPGGNARGKLSFEMMAWRTLSPVHQLLVARYTLTPADGAKPQQGLTTLLFERRKAGWKIISDHSS